jgi:hypothetical protein
MSDKAGTDSLVVPPNGSWGRYKSSLLKPTPLGFLVFNGRTVRAWGSSSPRMVPDGLYLSFEQSILDMCILHSSCPKSLRCREWSAGRARTVRAYVNFPKRVVRARMVRDTLFFRLDLSWSISEFLKSWLIKLVSSIGCDGHQLPKQVWKWVLGLFPFQRW